MSTILRTEFPFTLPRGYVDGDGSLHREGMMRLDFPPLHEHGSVSPGSVRAPARAG